MTSFFVVVAMVAGGRLQEKDVHTKIKQLYELCPGPGLDCCSDKADTVLLVFEKAALFS